MDNKEKYEVLKIVFSGLVQLMHNEIGWKFFREEMFNDTKSGENAQAMQEWLNQSKADYPTLWAELKPIFEEKP